MSFLKLNRSEFIKKIDNKFNIYIAQVGCWCPWSPNPDCLENQEYAETQLNTLMKEYKKNMNDKDIVFENRKASLFSTTSNVENDIVPVTEGDETSDTVATTETTGINSQRSEDEPVSIEMSEIKSSIEQIDAWSAQKLGLQ